LRVVDDAHGGNSGDEDFAVCCHQPDLRREPTGIVGANGGEQPGPV
jgi:hypothetical protein